MVTSTEHPSHEHPWGDADFVGGHPALDFLNTVADKGKTRVEEKLMQWRDMHAWAAAAGLLAPDDLKRFRQHPGLDGADELIALRRFREVAYEAILDVTSGRGDGRAMDSLAVAIRDAIGRSTLAAFEGRFIWRPDGQTAWRWVDAVALAFEHLMRSDDLGRVRQCGRCTWFFVDRGRGAGRRWCDMRTCGNRAKVQAFRDR
ncbi:CGNR zinc finger domain-containing protein [Trinickia sp. Y13]|uniref:CGNR zinc finger domain-containing protein n=1 Tax=Trinickia sp. Y13 TaxID=2917807 RepID=UPI0024063CCE|nr:CGNR zinc finger domain-containing protein [Trinickia sp. Y13]MDG0027539.1 CGNR zinc finger domain-containing protein [Trinickia sp. Y13]